MRNFLDYILESMNEFPIASFFFALSLITYVYTNRVNHLIKDKSEITVSEIEDGWGLTVKQCVTEPDLKGSYTECDDELISEIYNTEEEAEKEKKRILNSIKVELEQKDFLNFRILGKLFIYSPCLLLAIIAIYDIQRIKKVK